MLLSLSKLNLIRADLARILMEGGVVERWMTPENTHDLSWMMIFIEEWWNFHWRMMNFHWKRWYFIEEWWFVIEKWWFFIEEWWIFIENDDISLKDDDLSLKNDGFSLKNDVCLCRKQWSQTASNRSIQATDLHVLGRLGWAVPATTRRRSTRTESWPTVCHVCTIF